MIESRTPNHLVAPKVSAMMANISSPERAIISKALGTLGLLIAVRLLLTLGDSSLFCSSGSLWSGIVTLGFDILTIVVTPLIVALYREPATSRIKMAVLLIVLIGLAGYELIRNPCLIAFVGR